MVKKLLVFLFVVQASFAFSYDTIIISDLDDTIKRTNVDSAGRAIYNSIFTQKIFEGMDDLFVTMDSYTNGLYVLSNSPNALRFNILKLLRKFSINPIEVSTRRLIADRDGFEYKVNYVISKIKETSDKVILLGDDVGEDPEVYTKVKGLYPTKVVAIYIHKVKNREIPQGVKSYHTVFDVALAEYQSGRMNFAQAQELGESLAFDYDLSKVIPNYAHCPKDLSGWLNSVKIEFADLAKQIASKITNYCKMDHKAFID